MSAKDDALADEYADRLERAGYETLDAYRDDAVLVSVGGDGTVVYNAWHYDEPTILPVAKPDSEGNTIQLDGETFLDGIRALEEGRRGEDYRIETHAQLSAYRDDEELRGDFRALNDLNLHHRSPTHAAKFRVRVVDGDTTYVLDRAIGDGVVVATPFGATGYYRAITGGGFEEGIGVAFNNLHKPRDALDGLVLSDRGCVEVAVHEDENASSVLLARDNDPDAHVLEPGAPVEIRRSEYRVGIVRIDALAPDWRRY
ncbi:MAG: hypothetical protein ABEJ81_01295 [Haloferacaceae archaeon]